MAEQRYQAVLGVIDQGGTVKGVAARFGVSRQTVTRGCAGAKTVAWRRRRPGPTARGPARTR